MCELQVVAAAQGTSPGLGGTASEGQRGAERKSLHDATELSELWYGL